MSDLEVIERITIVKDKIVDPFIWGEPFHYAFFQYEISENGLENFHIDVDISLTESEKRREIAKVIYLWNENKIKE